MGEGAVESSGSSRRAPRRAQARLAVGGSGLRGHPHRRQRRARAFDRGAGLVGHRGRAIDGLLARGAGASARAPAGRNLVAAALAARVHHRVPGGRARSPAALHREHAHRDHPSARAPPGEGDPPRAKVANVARLWAVVLASNLVGALALRLGRGREPGRSLRTCGARSTRSVTRMQASAATNLLRGVFAGWLIALMVWLLPVARTSRVTVIVLITYLVGLGHLTHVVAGAVEVFYLPFRGMAGFAHVLGRYVGPALRRQCDRRRDADGGAQSRSGRRGRAPVRSKTAELMPPSQHTTRSDYAMRITSSAAPPEMFRARPSRRTSVSRSGGAPWFRIRAARRSK